MVSASVPFKTFNPRRQDLDHQLQSGKLAMTACPSETVYRRVWPGPNTEWETHSGFEECIIESSMTCSRRRRGLEWSTVLGFLMLHTWHDTYPANYNIIKYNDTIHFFFFHSRLFRKRNWSACYPVSAEYFLFFFAVAILKKCWSNSLWCFNSLNSPPWDSVEWLNQPIW